MNERKIAYLKTHLEQALIEKDHNEVNSCYKELLKLVNAADIPELVQQVNEFNNLHAKNAKKTDKDTVDLLKKRIRRALKVHKANKKIALWGILYGVLGMIFGCFLVMLGAGVFDIYNNSIMNGGLVVSIAGGILLLIGTIFAFAKNKSECMLETCKDEIFTFIRNGVDKLNYLENVETFGCAYVGQIKEKTKEPHGFGVGFCNEGIYVGEWKSGVAYGIGTWHSTDMRLTLEGEFRRDVPHGIVDIKWEDGSQWRGEYKDGHPWNGEGKTRIKEKILEGVWKNGMLINR